jgi:hypothetical protein
VDKQGARPQLFREESDKGNEKKYHSAAILLLLLAKDGEP